MKAINTDMILTIFFAPIAFIQETTSPQTNSNISLVLLIYFGIRAIDLKKIKNRLDDIENHLSDEDKK